MSQVKTSQQTDNHDRRRGRKGVHAAEPDQLQRPCKGPGASAGGVAADTDANGLIACMQSQPYWTHLGNNDFEASKPAGQHYMVIAGWVNLHGHGHVVVIVPGRANGHAKAFWESYHHASGAGADKGIDYAFDPHERREVVYFAVPVSALVTSQ